MRSTWTDERLDDLNNRVSDLSRRVDAGFERVDGRIDALQHTMIQIFVAIMAAMITGFVALAGLIVTQM